MGHFRAAARSAKVHTEHRSPFLVQLVGPAAQRNLCVSFMERAPTQMM